MKKFRFALETAAVRFGAWFVPKLPRPVVLALARAIGFIAWAADLRGRRDAEENLRVAFAKDHISPEQVGRIARLSYANFARTFLDFFWLARQTPETIRALMRLKFEDATTLDIARERGAVWVTPHFGNFEVIGFSLGSMIGFPMTIVAQNFKNPDLTGVFRGIRQNSGNTLVPQESAMLRLMKTLKNRGHTALLTDLNIKPGRMAAALRCFGLLTCSTTLHTSLSQRSGAPVIPCVCEALDDGTYLAIGTPAMLPEEYETPAGMAQAVWDRFEPFIRRRPEQWLWMYKHWRYQPRREVDPAYPEYALYWKEFEKIVDATAADAARGRK